MLHQVLGLSLVKLPGDYRPWGDDDRDEPTFGPDCSWGCRHFVPLEEPFDMDWGVCTNKASHRCGLLTFEHQGCRKFEACPVEAEAWDHEPSNSDAWDNFLHALKAFVVAPAAGVDRLAPGEYSLSLRERLLYCRDALSGRDLARASKLLSHFEV